MSPFAVHSPGPPGAVGREGVRTQRQIAALCLGRSAELAGLPATAFPRDDAGAPRPFSAGGGTWHWSTSNTAGMSAAVVAPAPVGLDLESLDRHRVVPLEAWTTAAERALLGARDRPATLALWTAKEAVLKRAGVGLAGLSRCRLAEPPTEGLLVLTHAAKLHRVRTFRIGRFVLALAWAGPGEIDLRPLGGATPPDPYHPYPPPHPGRSGRHPIGCGPAPDSPAGRRGAR